MFATKIRVHARVLGFGKELFPVSYQVTHTMTKKELHCKIGFQKKKRKEKLKIVMET